MHVAGSGVRRCGGAYILSAVGRRVRTSRGRWRQEPGWRTEMPCSIAGARRVAVNAFIRRALAAGGAHQSDAARASGTACGKRGEKAFRRNTK